MKNLKFYFVALLILISVSSTVMAQEPVTPARPETSSNIVNDTAIEYNSLYASAYTDLWQIDPYSGDFNYIGPIGFQGTDIAFDGENLYGISFSTLLSLDPTTGSGSVIGSIGYYDVNALTVAPDGTMYAGTISGALLSIDKSTGSGTLIGHYGPGLGSSGDLAIRYDNKMFASVRRSGYSSDWLAQIDMNTGRAIPIGEIGEYGVYGLDFKDWSLYGVTTYGHLLEIDTETGEGSRIATTSANFWGLSTSGPILTGEITSPPDNYTTGPASIPINATAEFDGGTVDQVEFYVFYDGFWHGLSKDETTPFTSGWETPSNLYSQQTLLRIDVNGTDNQNELHRASYAGGVRRLNIIQSMGDPAVTEVWVPTRAYLNQRSLEDYVDDQGIHYNGDWKCNVSSIAMVLAMDGYISTDYLTMANEANSLSHYLFPNPGVEGECEALRDTVPSAYCSGYTTQSDAWDIIKEIIDAGHPVIVDSRPDAATSDGHYIVAIGYKEVSDEHYLIAYDPYGEWRGYTDLYYRNSEDPASHVGKWVYYEFEEFIPNETYLFATISPPSSPIVSSEIPSSFNPTDLTPPDQISDEPRINVIFTGRETITLYPTYLPLINR